MKRVFAVLLLCMVISIPAWAQMESVKENQTQQEATMPGQIKPDTMGGQ